LLLIDRLLAPGALIVRFGNTSIGPIAVLLSISAGFSAQLPNFDDSEGASENRIGSTVWESGHSPLGWIFTDLFESDHIREPTADPAPVSLLEEIARLTEQPSRKRGQPCRFGGFANFDSDVDATICKRCSGQVTDAFSALCNNDVPYLLFDWSHSAAAGRIESPLRVDGPKRVASTKTKLDVAEVSSTVALREPDDPLDPGRRRNWETDESLRMAVAGPLFVFGQFGAATDWVDQQQTPKWQGKYGVGVKLKPWLVDEVQVRGGPAVRSDDSGRWMRGATGERSELFIEAVTKVGVPVVGPINFEYSSTTVPPANPGERNVISQDFKLARPLSGGGQVHIGAKYRVDDAPVVTTPWVERMQLYLGFELKR
jgi:hypothetical protein